MTLGEFVTQKHSEGFQFLTLDTARAAYAEAGLCKHTSTCFGVCDECGHVLNVEGTFKVNPDKSRYLVARRS